MSELKHNIREALSQKKREAYGKVAKRIWDLFLPGGKELLKKKLRYKSTSITGGITKGITKNEGSYLDFFEASKEVSLEQENEAVEIRKAIHKEANEILKN